MLKHGDFLKTEIFGPNFKKNVFSDFVQPAKMVENADLQKTPGKSTSTSKSGQKRESGHTK